MAVTIELNYLEQLENLLSNLVVTNTKAVSVEQLAKTVAKSTSLVYRAASPHDDTPFPIAWLPIFMNLKQDYAALNFISEITGFLPPTKRPNFKIIKEDETKVARSFTKITHRISENFEDHLEHPSTDSYREFKRNADEAIKQILSAVHYAKKAVKGCGEFEF